MKSAPVAILKARLSAFLRAVKRGEEVLVTERGRPVARLVPVSLGGASAEEREEMIRLGLLRPRQGPIPRRFWQRAPRAKDPEGGVLAALLAEREAGR